MLASIINVNVGKVRQCQNKCQPIERADEQPFNGAGEGNVHV